MQWLPDIYSFLDYRAYLRAYYDAAKHNVPRFSYRSFAERAGLASQSFLRDVIRGDKNIGTSLPGICKAIGLQKAEREFFELLVEFDGAATRQERNALFEQIAASKRFREARRLDEGMYRYLSSWYYPAIRELAAHDAFRPDPDWIAATLQPAITPAQAREALDALLDLGFLVADGERVRMGDPTITTGHEVAHLGVENYHHEMLRLAGESIRRFPASQRDLGAMTICVTPEDLGEIKRRIHGFREQILALGDERPGGTILLQFNTQLFPLNKVES